MTIVLLLHLREEVAIWGCQDKFKSIFLDGSHPHCGLVRLSIVLMEENSNPLNLLDRLLQDISLIWNYCDPTCVPATAPPFHPTKLRSSPCVQISLIWSIRSSSMVVNFWRTLEDLPQKKPNLLLIRAKNFQDSVSEHLGFLEFAVDNCMKTFLGGARAPWQCTIVLFVDLDYAMDLVTPHQPSSSSSCCKKGHLPLMLPPCPHGPPSVISRWDQGYRWLHKDQGPFS